MLTINGNTKLFIYNKPINMNTSFEGLSGIVENFFQEELYTGSVFIFLNKRKNLLKILSWDGDGFIIFYKRLEKGTFLWKWNEKTIIDRAQLVMLLEGIEAKKIHYRYSKK